MLRKISRVGEASEKLISTMQEKDADVSELQEMILGLTNAVASATATLVLKAKTVALATEDRDLQDRIIVATSQCDLATSQLVACSKVSFHYRWSKSFCNHVESEENLNLFYRLWLQQ